ncbi:MAG: NAD kinase [Bacteroidetes bacterium]|jgi:NAD+ kinase|nr:MAG: NAD kinase [Cryomorphaceae bacterium BACL29 MAG-121220-bin8]MDA0757709.1 NAD kinase [Bacteroidota bacterium]MDA1018853.1 NAD kinase [Bacteroidota bacterium]
MKIAVYSQSYDKSTKKVMQDLLDIGNQHNIKFYLESGFYTLLNINSNILSAENTFSSHKDLNNSFDLMITIGGDGTLLRSVSFVRNLDIPIIGINTGRLGFLATINQDLLKPEMSKILLGKYRIEKRTLLEVKIQGSKLINEFGIALNEVTIGRKNTTSMIKIKTILDGEYLNSYWADGLIISTPTGSTGYSLSCGGPIMSPLSQTLSLTPIAPHNLNARPLIISDKTKIELSVSGREKSHLLSLDSRIISVENESLITIQKASFKINLAYFDENSFYKSLRNKLLWGEDRRNL